jgi:hypothetical protein
MMSSVASTVGSARADMATDGAAVGTVSAESLQAPRVVAASKPKAARAMTLVDGRVMSNPFGREGAQRIGET